MTVGAAPVSCSEPSASRTLLTALSTAALTSLSSVPTAPPSPPSVALPPEEGVSHITMLPSALTAAVPASHDTSPLAKASTIEFANSAVRGGIEGGGGGCGGAEGGEG